MNSFALFITIIFVSFTNGSDPFIIRYGGDFFDVGSSVIQDKIDGGFVVTGTTFSYGSISNDVFLSKFDVNGFHLWTKTFGTAGMYFEIDDGYCVIQQTKAKDNNYGFVFIANSGDSLISGYEVIYLTKFDSVGNHVWTSKVEGSMDDIEAFSVTELEDGSLILVGNYYVSMSDVRILVSKFNPNGTHNFTKSFGSDSENDYGRSVSKTKDGGFVVAGYGGDGSSYIILSKFSSYGDLNWTTILGLANHNLEAFSVTEILSEQFIVTGYKHRIGSESDDDVILSKLNSDGSHNWTISFGREGDGFVDGGFSVASAKDGGFLVTGASNSFNSDEDDNYQLLVSKFDTNGVLNWTFTFEDVNGNVKYFGMSIQEVFDDDIDRRSNSDGFVVTGWEMIHQEGIYNIILLKSNTEDFLFLEDHCDGCKILFFYSNFETTTSTNISTFVRYLNASSLLVNQDPPNILLSDESSSVYIRHNSYFEIEDVTEEVDIIYDLYTCFGIFSELNYTVCSGHGDCISLDDCECGDYYGENCELYNCDNVLFNSSSEDVCSGHGNCTGFDVCECFEHYDFGEFCEINSCGGVLSIYPDFVCSGGHGSCIEYDTCECFEGYYSSSSFCGDWNCFGHHYLSENVCHGHGICVSPNECTCSSRSDEGYEQPDCVWKCFDIPFDSPSVCSDGNGECIGVDLCICFDPYEGDECGINRGLAIGLGISIPLTFILIFTGFLVCCIVCYFIVVLICFGICFCGCLLFRQLLSQKKRIKHFSKLKDFDLLLKEQELEDRENYAKLKINKNLFTVEFDEIRNIQILGEGGSNSVVFKSEWAGKIVAFKCFKTRSMMTNQDDFDEFEREVYILSSLAHPHVTQFFGACLKPPRVGILMEYCSKGEILGFILKFRKEYLNPYPIPEKIRLMIEICSALDYVHSRNVIHRDLKCENVLVSEDNSAKLMDFGLSRVVEGMSVRKTKRVGTSFYMAPELVLLGGDYDEKCDVFSFGIMMYIILRENPLPYGKTTITSIEIRVANDPNFRPNLEELDIPQTYEWMKGLISNCVLHESQKRYSCKRIREILKQNAEIQGEVTPNEKMKVEEEEEEEEIGNKFMKMNEVSNNNQISTTSIEREKEHLISEIHELRKENKMLLEKKIEKDKDYDRVMNEVRELRKEIEILRKEKM